MASFGVVDIQTSFVGGKSQAVRPSEVIGHERELASIRRQAVNALNLLFSLARVNAICRVGEVDGSIGLDDYIVGAIQLLAVEGFR
jgi:hypothetical protein